MYICVLGRQPEISIAELRAIFGDKNVEGYNNIAVLDVDEVDEFQFDRLGGTIKLAEVISNDWNDIMSFLPETGKATIGLSTYNTDLKAKTLSKITLEIKKHRKSVRFLPNKKTELSSATVYHNKLTEGVNKFEFILTEINGKKMLARTLFVQDIKSYSSRDFARPKRDAKVGMLPPKLAQIMINLAVENAQNRHDIKPGGKHAKPKTIPVILDPFCGTGVVLQEAALMGFNVYGTDIEERMIEYTTANLKWLSASFRENFFEKLEVGDATEFQWQPVMKFIVSETYLGKPYFVEPTVDTLRENVKSCNALIVSFLDNLHGQIEDNTRLCLAVPAWFVGGKTYRLSIIRKLSELGYKQQKISDKPLIYRRSDQIVARELLVLIKTATSAKIVDKSEKVKAKDIEEKPKAVEQSVRKEPKPTATAETDINGNIKLSGKVIKRKSPKHANVDDIKADARVFLDSFKEKE
jgi:tRNA G10  N-methylase Trm11